MSRKRLNNRSKGVYRSRYEYDIATNLKRRKIKFEYETETYVYQLPISKAECNACHSTDISGSYTYTPDFILPKQGLIVEAKGLFSRRDRDKTLAVLQSNNAITRDNFRLLFMQNRKLSPKATKRYADWCDDHEIIWAMGPEIPEEWVNGDNY